MITISDLNKYLSSLLDPDNVVDYGINGIQVDTQSDIQSITYGVDISQALVQKAIENKSQLIIVHHGLFWGGVMPLTGNHYKRVSALIKNDIGLIAYHLPLDSHVELGNNSNILRSCGINELNPFGKYKNSTIGWGGISPVGLSLSDILKSLGVTDQRYWRFSGDKNKHFFKIAAVSGGGAGCFDEALSYGYDLLITGEFDHKYYHTALESDTAILFIGHYYSETFGIKSLMDHMSNKFRIDSYFEDIPTGL